MELRSSGRKKEYNELRLTLNSMGFYEEGMELQEMRQVLDALQTSANESETDFLETDLQQALRESELDFMPIQDGRVINSTMMSINVNTSTEGSPETQPDNISVQAVVHHAMDWSPTEEDLPRKRAASISIEIDYASSSLELQTCNDGQEPNAKRSYNLSASNEKTNTPDSASSLVKEISYNSLQDVDSMDNSLASTSSLHEIRGPISVRRCNDSGLIDSYETPHSTSAYNLGVLTPPSAANLSNRQLEVVESPASMHEIHGPVSVRRIHDSGFNISTEAPNHSAVHNSAENSMSSLENSIQNSAEAE